MIKRLQGKEWHNIKGNLILIKYIANKNNHIKGIYKDKLGNKYTHWLNNKEISEVINNE